MKIYLCCGQEPDLDICVKCTLSIFAIIPLREILLLAQCGYSFNVKKIVSGIEVFFPNSSKMQYCPSIEIDL